MRLVFRRSNPYALADAAESMRDLTSSDSPAASSAALEMKRFPSVSVVICCHNSATRLPVTLRHLAEQRGCDELTWELLLVDNASTDGTVSLVQQFASEHPDLPVRIVSEPRLGTGYARQRGLEEARQEIILFVDDDNWLAPDYVRLVAEIMEKNPEVAGLGGMSTAECEIVQPSWLTRYQGWYAVTGTSDRQAPLADEGFLWTAGSAFRRAALDQIRSSASFLVSGRRGDTLDAGEDEELSHLIRLSGGRLCRDSRLHFQHYLPAKRLSWDYLRKLHHGGGLVSVKLDPYRFASESSRWPGWILHSWLAQVCNVCFQIARYRFRVGRLATDEGNDDVLMLDRYQGRLRALWSERRHYRKMIASLRKSV
jgi:glycosyltransferase involved in cell wall biosynthesis